MSDLAPPPPAARAQTGAGATALADSAFLRAARGEPVPHTPVWFMRQAGRSLPEYLAIREGVSMLDSCMRPEMVTEITLQPVRRYAVDAAIFFSDIVLPLKAIGVDLDIVPGVGPVVASPVRTLEDVAAIPDLTPDHVPYIAEAVRLLVAELGATPLIGFAGAPFTVASYLVEGGPSKDHARTKALMFGAPEVWDALLAKIAGISAAYLDVQVTAGASAVQLFDSWAGALTRGDYEQHVLPYSRQVLDAIGSHGVPRIHFGVGTGEILDLMGAAGAEVVGVDWRVPLAEGVRRAGGRCVQGNLDPTLVFAPPEVMLARADEVLEAGRAAPGHIFNLGHGVIPSTDPDQLKRLTDHVHEVTRR
jgi:uroporphyrinogen decarboxylase